MCMVRRGREGGDRGDVDEEEEERLMILESPYSSCIRWR